LDSSIPVEIEEDALLNEVQKQKQIQIQLSKKKRSKSIFAVAAAVLSLIVSYD
jgi:uncharacterized membrane-anchored protein